MLGFIIALKPGWAPHRPHPGRRLPDGQKSHPENRKVHLMEHAAEEESPEMAKQQWGNDAKERLSNSFGQCRRSVDRPS
jgi:hypothetical protein